MKALTLLIAVLFSFPTFAEQGQFTYCSTKNVKNITSYDDDFGSLSTRTLSPDEVATMKQNFDEAYNCDEGVELQGVVKTVTGADYLATCWADSLGQSAVKLTLNCEQQ